MWSNTEQSARLEKGRRAWLELEGIGGLLPLPENTPAYWPTEFWHGMGEFEAQEVQEIIQKALPSLTFVERRWPWVAKAAFDYKSDYRKALARFDLKGNADSIASQIRDRAEQLQDSLLQLSELAILPPSAIGKMNWDKAWGLSEAINEALGGAANAHAPDQGLFGFQRRLEKLKIASLVFQKPVGTQRLRGRSNPSLLYLVVELGLFWMEATSRRPSAAKPSRKDGKEAPFVRLLNDCARLAGAPEATRKQVQGVLASIPFAS